MENCFHFFVLNYHEHDIDNTTGGSEDWWGKARQGSQGSDSNLHVGAWFDRLEIDVQLITEDHATPLTADLPLVCKNQTASYS